ncbi:M23 family metallopeptidase [Dolichospermum circinale CS-1225]|uniref:M23 family metallopeptidase n=1 Tax=Dolichospermum circinale CS-537/01 TaxID=3021739 RepID=A0ABT5A773_9CYAN|nr:M23 family metallopeptidase [Dolichospermum circinale]MDB9457325.1 M23 family metallopeptidase [Dolichospermum circinale CS-545/17]MDB9487339.1 M23 family metallopeptidase [Dolichospermum circinale CS-537/01]MDB9522501.1 M23 family metallopeptidase [Dolichospermum circinale CS-1225]
MSNRVKILLGIITAIPMALGLPAKALEVQIMPKNPQLGDTISVLIEADNQKSLSNPTVTVGEKNYPAFEIAPRQYRSFIPTTPLEKAGVRTIKVSEEGQEQKLSIQVRDRKFAVQRITLPPGKAGVKATQEELKRVAEFKALQTPEKYWNGVFLTPNAGRTSTRYGVRRYYNGVFANDYYHRGQDYAGAAGSSVTAPAAGRVALVGTVSQGFRVHGNVIGIDHGQGVISIFMHLSRINVQEGDFVKAGQKIGAVGSTGASTGPHLHWGLYVNGQSVDPLPWKSQEIK